MSREVTKEDLGSMTSEDILYLAQRGQLTPEDEAEIGEERLRKALQPEAKSLDEQAHTGDANTDGVSKEDFEAAVERARVAEEKLREERGKKKGPEENIVGSYATEDGWNNDKRRGEIEKRGMDPTGLKKDDAIMILQASDEAGGGAVEFSLDENGDAVLDEDEEG